MNWCTRERLSGFLFQNYPDPVFVERADAQGALRVGEEDSLVAEDADAPFDPVGRWVALVQCA